MNFNFNVVFPAVCVGLVVFIIILAIFLLSSYVADSIKEGTEPMWRILICIIADLIVVIASVWVIKGIFDILFFG